MTRRFGTLALSSAALGSALVVFAHQANAQKYDDDGQEPAATQDDDGFRPVWAQKQAPKAAPHDSRKSQSPLPHVAEQKPSPPLRTETTVYGRWTVTCQEANLDKDAKKTCAATLPVVDANKRLVLLWRLDSADGKLRSVMQTPTGVLVQKGVALAVGNTQIGTLAYAGCVPQNCEAAGPIDDPMLHAIEAAPELVVTIHAMDGRDLHFTFPLTGIDKAVAAVRS